MSHRCPICGSLSAKPHMHNKKLIAYSGTHSTGKTTAVYKKAYELKQQGYAEVGVLLETARECPFPVLDRLGRMVSREAQIWIFSTQMKREIEMRSKYSAVVSDRCIIDPIAYSLVFEMHDLVDWMLPAAKCWIESYDEIIFRPIVSSAIEDGFRSTDEIMRKAVEDAILGLFDELCYKPMIEKSVG